MDGKLLSDWKTDYRDMSSVGEWRARDFMRLAVGTWDSPSIFYHADVLELSGEGKVMK